MGTTNRAFTPSLHKAQMMHQANTNNRLHSYRKKMAAGHEKKTFSVYRVIKAAFKSVLNFFGFGKPAYVFPVASFNTPTHSPYGCGKRDQSELDRRKARRQKRTALKMKRGYA